MPAVVKFDDLHVPEPIVQILRVEPELLVEISGDLYRLMDEGKLKPYISARYALADAPQALRDLLDRKATGKVVIEADR